MLFGPKDLVIVVRGNDLIHRYRQRWWEEDVHKRKEAKMMFARLFWWERERAAEEEKKGRSVKEKLSLSINICYLPAHAVYLLLRLMMIFKIILSNKRTSSCPTTFHRVTIDGGRYCTTEEIISFYICLNIYICVKAVKDVKDIHVFQQ